MEFITLHITLTHTFYSDINKQRIICFHMIPSQYLVHTQNVGYSELVGSDERLCTLFQWAVRALRVIERYRL